MQKYTLMNGSTVCNVSIRAWGLLCAVLLDATSEEAIFMPSPKKCFEMKNSSSEYLFLRNKYVPKRQCGD